MQRPNPHTRNFEIFKGLTYRIEEFTHPHKGASKFSNSLHVIEQSSHTYKQDKFDAKSEI